MNAADIGTSGKFVVPLGGGTGPGDGDIDTWCAAVLPATLFYKVFTTDFASAFPIAKLTNHQEPTVRMNVPVETPADLSSHAHGVVHHTIER